MPNTSVALTVNKVSTNPKCSISSNNPEPVNSIHGRLTPAQKVKPNMAEIEATPGRHSQSPMQTDPRGQLGAGIFLSFKNYEGERLFIKKNNS